jgi:hypothetical protein
MKALHGRLQSRPFVLGLPAAAGLLLFALGQSKAQPPDDEQATEVRGNVQRMTTAPRGEIDGAVLDNGTWLHWPPHMQAQFANLIKQGDQVRASGRTETGPAGDTHFEVQSVTDLRTNATAENPDFANGPPLPGRGSRGRGRRMRPPVGPVVALAPDARNRSPAVEVRGGVQRMTTAPRGEIDGAVLDNGTSLHWPPHMQAQFSNVIKAGDQVRATGRTETGPAGDTHFEVQSVTNLRSNARAENPDYAVGPPAPPIGQQGPSGRMPTGPAAAGNFTEVRGTVRSMTTAPRGEVDGAMLDNGTWLHWPPHMQDRFTSAIKVGDQVRATGRTETGPAGDTHFEIQTLTNLGTSARVDNPDLAMGPAGAAAPIIPNGAIDLEQRLRDLTNQIDQLRREVRELRGAKR